MTMEEYLQHILQREAADTGPYPPVRSVQAKIEPAIREWAGIYLSSISPCWALKAVTAKKEDKERISGGNFGGNSSAS